MNDLQQFQPEIMGILGGSMQYLRGVSKFPEPVYHLMAVLFAAFGYFLFNVPDLSNWRAFTIKALIGTAGLLLPLWGGTFAASGAAKAGASFIPVTNSLGGSR